VTSQETGRRLPFVFIVITLTIDSMGIGLIMPVMPELIRALTGQGIAEAAYWGGLIAFSYAAMQVLFGPIVGNLSDAHGRKPVLLFSLIAMGIDYFVMALAGSVWLLFLARIVSGITGATYATAYAYVTDLSTREKRAANFGLVGAAFGVGFVLGPALGGVLGELGTRAPFWAAGILALANAGFGLMVVRESHAPANRRAFTWARANPLRAVMRIASLPAIGGLVLVLVIYSIAHNVYPVIWAYFAVAQYGWTPGMIGLSLTIVGVAMALIQGGLIRVILRRLGTWRTAYLGLGTNIALMAVIPAITNGYVALALAPLMAMGGLSTPALQGIMANRTADDSQGELQGVMSSAQGLASIIAPLVLTQSFQFFTAADAPVYLPGAPFLLAAALMAIALTLTLRERRRAAA